MSNGNMRAQLSLLFTDKNLFDNFIVPCKNDRRLHSIIMKCLSAYYYNVEVRNLIEGAELHTDTETTEKINSHQDSINNIRDLLAMQGFISKELENTMEDGIDDMSDMLDHVNKTAEDFSVVKTTETEYGGKSMKLIGMSEENNKTTSNVKNTDSFAPDIVKMVTQMYTMFSKQDSFKQMFGGDIVNLDETVDNNNDNISKDMTSIPSNTDIGDLDIQDFVAPPPSVSVEIVENETDNEIDNVGEASGALSDLLSSLNG